MLKKFYHFKIIDLKNNNYILLSLFRKVYSPFKKVKHLSFTSNENLKNSLLVKLILIIEEKLIITKEVFEIKEEFIFL